MSFFLNGDDVLNGIKRGAEKFGTSSAAKVVKKMAKRMNGFTPKESEPYGLGMGGADSQQESQAPTQALGNDIPKAKLRQQKKLDFLKMDLELVDGREERKYIEDQIKALEAELAGKDEIRSNGKNRPVDQINKEIQTIFSRNGVKLQGMSQDEFWGGIEAVRSKNAGDASKLEKLAQEWERSNSSNEDATRNNEDSSDLGYQSAQKTTTAESSDDHDMQSKCLACGYESQGKWNGVCESCLVKNDIDVAGNLDEEKDNGIAINQPEPWAEEMENSTCPKCGDTLVKSGKKDSGGADLLKCPSCATRENVGPEKCTKCGQVCQSTPEEVDGKFYHDSCVPGTFTNAGHLQPESWMAASAEERVKWLQEASQDINLAGLPWDELSLDVHRALQREFDKAAEGALSNASDKCPNCGGSGEVSVTENCPECKGSGKYENAGGKMPTYIFQDSNGEKESVLASSESEAWEKLSHDFGTPLADLKSMLKIVKVIGNEKENASDTAIYDELRKVNAEISKLDGLGQGRSNEDHSRLKKLLLTKAGLEKQLKNSDPEGDLSEIERHAEGVLHEAEELKEEGLENGPDTYHCQDCSFESENKAKAKSHEEQERHQMNEVDVENGGPGSGPQSGGGSGESDEDKKSRAATGYSTGEHKKMKDAGFEQKDAYKWVHKKTGEPVEKSSSRFKELTQEKPDPIEMKNSGVKRGLSKYGSKKVV